MIQGIKIKGFSNYWIFPTLGMVWSLFSNRWIGSPDKDGYMKLSLCGDDGETHPYRLSRLIWEAVNGEIPEGYEVNHTTEDKNLNGIQHLSLCTHKENVNFGTGNQRRAEKLSKQVGAFKDGVLVMIFPSTQEAQRQGYSAGNISQCCRNCFKRAGNNTYKGYQWKYLN